MNIVLICQNGGSTTMIERKIDQVIKAKGLEITVNAYPESKLAQVIQTADVILLGPQIGYKLPLLKNKFPAYQEVMMVMDITDYGMLDGEAILQKALQLLPQ